MSKPSIGRRILDVMTTIPTDIEWQDILTNTAIGGGLGLTGALLLSKKENRKRNALIGLGLGSALGGYSSVLAKNIRKEMGGHYKKEPEWYDPEKILEVAKKSNKDRVTLYVSGADDTPRGAEKAADKLAEDGVLTFRWGDSRKLAMAAEKLKKAGYKVDMVGHSAGATALFGALSKIKSKYRLDSVSFVDPVDLHWRRLIPMSSRIYSKLLERKAAKSMLHLAKDRRFIGGAVAQSANKWVHNNPLAVLDIRNINTLWHNDNHGMHTTGLRMPVSGVALDEFGKSVSDKIHEYFAG